MEPVPSRRDPIAAGRGTIGGRPGQHLPPTRPAGGQRRGLSVPFLSLLIPARGRGIARLRRRHPLRQLVVARRRRRPGMLLGLAIAPVDAGVPVGRGLVALLSQPITLLGPTIAPLGGQVAVGGPVVPAGGELVAAGSDLIAHPGLLRTSPPRVVGRSWVPRGQERHRASTCDWVSELRYMRVLRQTSRSIREIGASWMRSWRPKMTERRRSLENT
jgi:hypothetical protein